MSSNPPQYDQTLQQLERLNTRTYAPHVSVAITALAHAVLAVAEAIHHLREEPDEDPPVP